MQYKHVAGILFFSIVLAVPLSSVRATSSIGDGSQSCINNYGSHSIWTGQLCACALDYSWNSSDTQCVADTPIGTSKSSRPELTSTQINAILSLLQAFGVDATTIYSVQAALGQ